MERLIIARLEHDNDRPLSENTGKRILERLERVEARLDAISAVCEQILLARCREERRRAG
jgi:hypothetical protein